MTVDPDKISIGLGLLTQLATLAGIVIAIIVSVRNGTQRKVEAADSKVAQEETHKLVNSRMDEFKAMFAEISRLNAAQAAPAPGPVAAAAAAAAEASHLELPAAIGEAATIVPKPKK